MDTISINRLKINCIIGCNADERTTPQDIYVTAEMQVDCSKAGHSDNLEDTVNYSTISKAITALAINGQFKLIEALAENTATLCLGDHRIKSVTVTVEKPGGIRQGDSASVKITRP